jgi:hypothetical protein
VIHLDRSDGAPLTTAVLLTVRLCSADQKAE